MQRDGLRDHHPLALAAGQFMRIAVQPDAAGGKPTRSSFAAAISRASERLMPAMDDQRFGDLRTDRPHRVQRRHRLLENHPDARPRTPHIAASSSANRSSRQAAPRRRMRHPTASSPITASAVIDLPDPDSPATPKICPASMDRLASSTDRMHIADAHGQIVDGETPGSSTPPQPWVEMIAQPVTRQVQPQHGGDDGKPRQHRQMRGEADHRLAVRQHPPP